MVQELQTISAEPITAMPGEILRIEVDFTLFGLDPTELLTGTPTVTEATGTVTISSAQVNTATFINKRKKPVAIGKGVVFICTIPSVVVDETDLNILVGCGTSSSPAQFLQGRCPLWIRDED